MLYFLIIYIYYEKKCQLKTFSGIYEYIDIKYNNIVIFYIDIFVYS